MNSADNPTADIASQILERENQERQALALLLDRHLARNDQLLVQKTQMGSTEAFIGSVTLEWLDGRVRFASQLPLFRQKFDPQTDNVVRDEETIDEILQRPLDWSRQASLTQYLAARKAHKFPAVLVVHSPAWVDNPKAPEWDKHGRALKSAADFTPLDKNDTVGLLDVSENVSIFALDGQHRLMGVQGLMTLLKTGRLQRYNKWKKPVGSVITSDDLIEEYQLDPAYLQSLAHEKIGIEFIEAFTQLFDQLSSLPSYQRLEGGEETPQLRRFSFEKNGGEGNILFRPVGQVAIAQALGILIFQKGLSLKEVFKKLRKYDVDDGFSGMENPQSLWYGVLYDPNKKRVLVSGRDLAARLLVYIIAGTEDDMERAELRRELAEVRTIEGKAVGFNGKFVKPREVGLPDVL